MKVETQFLEDHQAEIVAEFDPEDFQTAKQRSAKQLAKKVKIPGFRPGKAPYNVIERVVGEEAIVDGAVELLVNENYPKILDEAGIEPYAAGSLDEIQGLEPPTFRFVVPLSPDITLGDYHSLRHPYEPPVVGDDEVDNVLHSLQERQAIVEPVERAVEGGDQITAQLSGRRVQVEDGQDEEIIPEREQTIDVAAEGDDVREEWPFPGFSQHLIGMAAGDEKTIPYTYPDDFYYEDLRSVDAEFHVEVVDVKARTLPELSDEFAQGFGDFETLDDLKARIRENVEHETQRSYDDSYNEDLLKMLLADATIKYPPQMLQEESDRVKRELEMSLEQRGLNLETYLKTRQMDEDGFNDEVRSTAEERIRRNLALVEISKQDDIKVSNEAVQAQAYQTIDQISRSMSPKEARKMLSQDFITNLMGGITVDMYTSATLEHLRAIAKGEVSAPSDEEVVSTDSEETADAEDVSIDETVPEAEPETTVDADETVIAEAAVVDEQPLLLAEDEQNDDEGDKDAESELAETEPPESDVDNDDVEAETAQ